jgi:endoglycosylceramidase
MFAPEGSSVSSVRRPPRFSAALLSVTAILIAAMCCSVEITPSSATLSAPTAQPSGLIGHSGRWLVDSTGRVVIPHGVNLVIKEAPFSPLAAGFDAKDASFVANNGFRLVRLGVLFGALMPEPGKIDFTYLDQIARTVNLLAHDHVYVLLDMHQDEYGPAVGVDGFPKWATLTANAPNPKLSFPAGYFHSPAVQAAWANFWADAPGPGGIGLQERYDAALSALATKFKTDDWVLGYDVMNEPWPGPQYATCETDVGCPALEQQLLAPFYTKAARSIRKFDPRHLIFVEPFLTFDYDGNTSLAGFGSPDNGLSFHPYIAGQIGAGIMSRAVALSSRNGDALLVTEFGATTDTSSLTEFAGGFDAQMMPWIYWSLNQYLVADLHKAPGGSNVPSPAALGALVRPYPLAIAGVPTSFAFDAATRRFSLDYTTRRVTGGTFEPGTVTDVLVPRSTYPKGYSVSVVGATVRSKPCSSSLTLRATGPTVNLTVTPGGGCQ